MKLTNKTFKVPVRKRSKYEIAELAGARKKYHKLTLRFKPRGGAKKT